MAMSSSSRWQVSGAYFSLEAAWALLQSSGASGMAAPLVEAIEDSMDALKPFLILDQLKVGPNPWGPQPAMALDAPMPTD